jgi:hypothetical protein
MSSSQDFRERVVAPITAGLEAYRAGDFALAVETLKGVLPRVREAEFPEVWSLLGDASFRNRGGAPPSDSRRAAFGKDWNMLGLAYCELGEIGKAIETFQEGLRWMPGDAELWRNLEILLGGFNPVRDGDS